jgi:outer membrane receptor for ferrienterochelin and colicins
MSIAKRPLRFAWLLLFLAASAGAEAANRCPVEVTVTDAAKRPVTGAAVRALAGSSATTGADGVACLDDLTFGRHELLVVADGFAIEEAAVVVSPGDVELRVVLRPAFGEELVVTATRTPRRLVEIPVHTRVLGRETIESTLSRTLADALEWSPGVRVESGCQNCNVSQIRMLGLDGPYTQVLVDGQPTVSSLAMVYGIEQLPARLIESIEVVKGGGSALYGGGAVGGVVNLIPHQPVATGGTIETRAIEIGGELGYSLSGVGDWTRPSGGRSLSLFGQVDRVEPHDRDGDGFSEVSERRLESGGLRLEQYLLEDRARLSGELNRTRERRRGGDLRRFELPPDQTELTEAIATDRDAVGLRWLHTLSSRWDYQLAASWAGTERESYYGAGFDPDAYGTTRNPLFNVDAQANRSHAQGTLTWGSQWTHDEISDRQLGRGRVIEEAYSDLGLFVQDDRRLGSGWTLLYGARSDWHSALDEPVLSPRAALLWSPRLDFTLRASLARGFRPPAVFDEDLHVELVGGGRARVLRNAPDLREETSTAALVSGEWRPFFYNRGSAALEFSVYHTRLDDRFQTIEDDDPATPELELTRINFGRAEVTGAELAVSWRWGSRLEGEVGVVEQRARLAEPEPDFGSRAFLRTPERHALASVTWRLPREIDLFLGARYTGPMLVPHYAGFVAEDRLETTRSFTTLDLNASWRLPLTPAHEPRLTVGVQNLTDAYQTDLDRGPDRDAAYVYGPRFPRGVVVGLELSW